MAFDSAHRDGDLDATIWGKFNFATSTDLTRYDEIWLIGYNGYNKVDSKMQSSTRLFQKKSSLRIRSIWHLAVAHSHLVIMRA